MYYGDGKGKTTASVGLAVRAKGAGFPVLFLQFMKDGKSSELAMLRQIGVEVWSGQPEGSTGFTWELDEEGLKERRAFQDARLEEAFRWLNEHQSPGALIIDEALSAMSFGLLDEERLKALVDQVKLMDMGPDLVITGHVPPQWLLEQADYLSEIRAVRHPYERGISARKGIEY